MSQARSAPSHSSAMRLVIGLVITLLLLMGCKRTDDLGRIHHFSPLNDPHPSRKAIFGPHKHGDPLTDEEKQLRALADGIFAATYTAKPLGKPGSDKKDLLPGVRLPLNQEAYADYIVKGPFRSVTARYARLIDDTRDDISRLEAFFPVARKVADLDAARTRGLANVHGLTEAEVVAARRRVRENMMLMTEVHRTLAQRAAIYHFTLERLVIAAPSPMAIDADRIRTDLERRLATIQVTAPPAPLVADAAPHVAK